MTENRPSSWDPSKRAAYLEEAAEKAAALQRKKDGEATAEALDGILADLDGPAKAVMEAMVATDRRSFIAPHDHPDLRPLICAGLLAYPRGQGGQWMRAAKTSYTVPAAVWDRLQSRFPSDTARPNSSGSLRIEPAKALLDSIASGEIHSATKIE